MTTQPLHVAPRACSTCPYKRSTPSGIWHPDEYAKLAEYDADPGPLSTFHCHQEQVTGRPTACRGWLTVHRDGVAVRLSIARGLVTVEQRDADSLDDLYATGSDAFRAGMRDIARPSRAAIAAQSKLLERGEFQCD